MAAYDVSHNARVVVTFDDDIGFVITQPLAKWLPLFLEEWRPAQCFSFSRAFSLFQRRTTQ